MKPVLLIDFGSTWTKVTAVDVDTPKVLGTAASYTTVQTDIGEGLADALRKLEQTVGRQDYAERYACSSAAGGLRMAVSGLVPELTAQAAKMASLGAGAKVIRTFSFELTDEDIEEIDTMGPDIFLLTGGTNGGNTKNILHNAGMLATCKTRFPIVLAGNRSCAKQCEERLAGREVHRCKNVMPSVGKLDVEPAQAVIREVFLHRIVEAKGLSKAAGDISGILMPTPGAMLQAMKLLAEGCDGEKGIGELMAVDLGGATTDVYSIADGSPRQMATVLKGLPEPFAKRTVEGDMGMRYSAKGIAEAAGMREVAALAGLTEARAGELVRYIGENTETLPDTPELQKLDRALASLAVRIAVERHAGTMERFFTPMGEAYAQTGKDLRDITQIIATGGALIHARNPKDIVRHARYDPEQPMSLRPKEARVLVDRKYILAAMGLLGEKYPQAALRIMKQEVSE